MECTNYRCFGALLPANVAFRPNSSNTDTAWVLFPQINLSFSFPLHAFSQFAVFCSSPFDILHDCSSQTHQQPQQLISDVGFNVLFRFISLSLFLSLKRYDLVALPEWTRMNKEMKNKKKTPKDEPTNGRSSTNFSHPLNYLHMSDGVYQKRQPGSNSSREGPAKKEGP